MSNRTYEEMKKQVDDYFDNLTDEQFQLDLKKSNFEFYNKIKFPGEMSLDICSNDDIIEILNNVEKHLFDMRSILAKRDHRFRLSQVGDILFNLIEYVYNEKKRYSDVENV